MSDYDEMTNAGMEYLTRLPTAIAPGKVLVHDWAWACAVSGRG